MANVDNRVVIMTFENDKFEKGVATSIKSLDKLKDSLKFEDSSKGLDNLSKTVSNFNTDKLVESADKAAKGFSAMEVVAITAIAKITSGIMDLGANLIKQLSLDPIMEGFAKYESELKSIQTIMVTTGNDIATVTDEMRRLAWYTDETSYSYSDMVENIAKFTSQGIELEDAVSSMQGIANMAGYAGASVQDATHAMEGFSKAMGAGFMSRQNWQWIQTAHMETEQIKEIFIEAAVQCGTLKRGIDGVARTAKGATVTVGNFAENLKEQWLDSNVMDYANRSMSEYSDLLNAFSKRLDRFGVETLQCSDYMDILDGDVSNLADDVQQDVLKNMTPALILAMKDVGIAVKDEAEAYEYLNYVINSNSRIGFEQAQMYRTLGDAVSATTTAVATGWKEIFGYLFGNADEARILWSSVGDTMYDVFVTDLNELKESLKGWSDRSGFYNILNSFENIVEGVGKVAGPIKEVLKNLIPTPTTEQLIQFTHSLEVFTEELQWSKEASEGLRIALSVLNGPIDLAKKGLKAIFKIVVSGIVYAATLVEMVFSSIYAIKEFLGEAKLAVAEIFQLEGAGQIISDIFYTVKESFLLVADAISQAVSTIAQSETISKIFYAVGGAAEFLGKVLSTLLGVVLSILQSINFKEIIGAFDKLGVAISNFCKRIQLSEKIQSVIDQLGEMLNKMADAITDFIKRTDIGGKITQLFTIIIGAFIMFAEKIADFSERHGIGEKLEKFFSSLLGLASDFTDSFVKVLSAESFRSALSTAVNFVIKTFGSLGLAISDLLSRSSNEKGVEGLERMTSAFSVFATSLTGLGTKADTASKNVSAFTKMSKPISSDYSLNTSLAVTAPMGVKNSTVLEERASEFASMGESLKKFGENLNVGTVSAMAFAAAMSVFVLRLSSVASSLSYTIKTFGYFGDAVWAVGEELKRGIKRLSKAYSAALDAWAMSKVIGAVALAAVSIGASILLIASSLEKLEALDGAKMWSGVGAIVATLASFAGISLILVKLLKTFALVNPAEMSAVFGGLAIGLGSMVVCIVLLTGCIERLAKIEKGVWTALAVIASLWALLMTFAGFAATCTAITPAMTSMSLSMLKFSLAINSLTLPVVLLSYLSDKVDLTKGLTVVAELMVMFLAFGFLVQFCDGMTSDITKFAASMAILGIAINLMTVPIIALSRVPEEKIGQGTKAVRDLIVLFGLIGIAATFFDGLTSNLMAFAGAMALLGVAIDLMTAPIIALSLVPEEKIHQGENIVLGLIGLFTIIGILATWASGLKSNLLAFAGSMALLALAINELVIPITMIGSLSPEVLLKGVGVCSLLLILMGGIAAVLSAKDGYFTSKSIVGNIAQFGLAMVGIASAIAILTIPIALLGSMDLGMLAKGVGAVGVLMIFIGVLVKMVTVTHDQLAGLKGSVVEDIVQFGFAFFAMSVSIALIAGVIVLMNKLLPDISGALVASISLAAVVVALVASLAAIKELNVDGKDITKLVIMEASILLIAGALYMLKDIPWNQLILSAVAMGTCILALSVALEVLAGLGAGVLMAGGGIALVCAGILALAYGLNVLSNVNMQGLNDLLGVIQNAAAQAGDLLVIGAVLAAIGAGCVIAGAGFVVLGMGLVSLGAGLVVLGLAASLFATFVLTLATLAPVAQQAADVFMIFVQTVAAAAPLIATTVGTIIIGIAIAIEQGATHIVGAITVVVTAIITCLSENAITIAETLVTILMKVLDLLIQYFPQFVTLIVNALTAILDAIRVDWVPKLFELIDYILNTVLQLIVNFVPNLISAGIAIIVSIIEGISSGTQQIVEAGWEAVISFINGIAEGIDKHGPELKEACKNLIDSFVGFLLGKDSWEAIKTAGKNAVQGFINGVKSFFGKGGVEDAGKEVGKSFEEGIVTSLEIHSPSKVTMKLGQHATTGFLTGTASMLPKVAVAGEEVGMKFEEGLNDPGTLSDIKKSGENVTVAAAEGVEAKEGILKRIATVLGINWADTFTNTAQSRIAAIFEPFEAADPALWSLSAELTGDEYAIATGQMADGNEDVKDSIDGATGSAEKQIKTFEQLRDEYGFGSEAIYQFTEMYGQLLHKINPTVNLVDAATYAVSKLAETMYEEAGGALDIAYATQEELEQVMSDIAMIFVNTEQQISDTIRGIDIYSEFEYNQKSFDIDKMLLNANQWYTLGEDYKEHMIAMMADKRIEQSMIDYVTSLGYEEAIGWVDMLLDAEDEQLDELQGYYRQINELAEEAGGQAMATRAATLIGLDQNMTVGQAEEMGKAISEALAQGINPTAGQTNVMTLCENILGTMQSTLDLKVVYSIIDDVCMGVGSRFEDLTPAVTPDAHNFTYSLIHEMIETLHKEGTLDNCALFKNAQGVGTNVLAGIRTGIGDPTSREELITSITTLCNDLIEAAKGPLKVESPSKVFKEIGEFIDLGLAKGIVGKTDAVIKASGEMAGVTIDSFSNVIGRIADFVDGNFDYDPVIRPTLDLSNVEAGANTISSLLAANKYAAEISSIGSNQNGATTGAQYQFVQNNYSPKSLSRIDIYRQTKNQFAMMKEVTNAR